ncbi:MAG: cupin domain-containing protein [Methyloceanibacter sp.]|nr:cupin domain-containing protein [Methyloceanibacter sp.]
MKPLVLVLIILAMICSSAHSANAPAIVVIDGETPTNEIARMPNGGYVGETIIHRSPDERVQVGVWEADVSKVRLVDFPVTEYVLMLSGRLVVVNEDGSSNTFEAGDTFVIPKGFTGIWDVQERMKKQHIKIGDPRAELIVLPVED